MNCSDEIFYSLNQEAAVIPRCINPLSVITSLSSGSDHIGPTRYELHIAAHRATHTHACTQTHTLKMLCILHQTTLAYSGPLAPSFMVVIVLFLAVSARWPTRS